MATHTIANFLYQALAPQYGNVTFVKVDVDDASVSLFVLLYVPFHFFFSFPPIGWFLERLVLVHHILLVPRSPSGCCWPRWHLGHADI